MSISFEEFIEKYLGEPFQLYPYQKEFLKDLQSNNEPFNISIVYRNSLRYSKRFEHMLNLYWNLLNNNDVLDLFLALHFKFEMNEYNELELVIDEYSQPTGTLGWMIMNDLGENNISRVVFKKVIKPKTKEFTDHMLEALEVIKEIT